MTYTLEQIRQAERENRTLVQSVQSMLYGRRVTVKLWGEAIHTAAYFLNRAGSRTRGNKTPPKLWTGEKPNVDHLRAFGCVAYAHIPKPQRKKLEPKSQKVILVGYRAESKGAAYRLWDSHKHRIIISRDLVFDQFAFPSDSTNQAMSGLFCLHDDIVQSEP